MNSLLRGTLVQRLRLFSGLVLFAFALVHFLTHSIGIFGVDRLQSWQDTHTFITRTKGGAVVLYGAMIIHIVLGLAKLATRTTWRMPASEALQLALGLAIPILLIPHVVNTVVANRLGLVDDVYPQQLAKLWPEHGLKQSVLLLVVWLHGCLGLRNVFRQTLWYPEWRQALFAAALLVPALALAGFVSAGREQALRIATPAARAAFEEDVFWTKGANAEWLAWLAETMSLVFVACLIVAMLIPVARWIVRRYLGGIEVVYDAGPTVRAPVGPTLLEISRMFRVPHTSACGGRARCSTCRVRILKGGERLEPAGPAEIKALKRVRAGDDVRLACQIRPRHDLNVLRILRPHATRQRRTVIEAAEADGIERTMTVMFLDLRGFTALSEKRLPYDVVYILNRFFAHAGAAVVDAGGHIDKYLGDGLMAVFGESTSLQRGARDALAASIAIDLMLDTLALELQSDLKEPLRLGIGIHTGPMVMGRIGYGTSAAVTVIGRTVNTASRLQSLTKDYSCQLAFSEAFAQAAGVPTEGLRTETAEIRGLSEPMTIYCIERARSLRATEVVREVAAG